MHFDQKPSIERSMALHSLVIRFSNVLLIQSLKETKMFTWFVDDIKLSCRVVRCFLSGVTFIEIEHRLLKYVIS